ncbi:MAG: HAD family hydrolase [Bacilli bacterium]|nr:HAD family hydrolase [Bacilli bacterium]
MNKKIIIYDFDGTLTPYPITKIEVLESLGFDGGMMSSKFMGMVRERRLSKNIDVYNACYEVLLEVLKNNNVPRTQENFRLGAENIEYNPGVYDFFDRNKGLNIVNYIVSSGSKDFLEGITISKFFKEIYATTFKFDDSGEASDVDFLMSDKRKVEIIQKILKDNDIENEDCSNVIYVGDGLTDLYAMEYVKNHGGDTIFVYVNEENDSLKAAREVDVVSYYTKADFNLNSDFSNVFLDICS